MALLAQKERGWEEEREKERRFTGIDGDQGSAGFGRARGKRGREQARAMERFRSPSSPIFSSSQGEREDWDDWGFGFGLYFLMQTTRAASRGAEIGLVVRGNDNDKRRRDGPT